MYRLWGAIHYNGGQLTPDQAHPPPGTTSSRVTHPGDDLLLGGGGISSVTERLVAIWLPIERVVAFVSDQDSRSYV